MEDQEMVDNHQIDDISKIQQKLHEYLDNFVNTTIEITKKAGPKPIPNEEVKMGKVEDLQKDSKYEKERRQQYGLS